MTPAGRWLVALGVLVAGCGGNGDTPADAAPAVDRPDPTDLAEDLPPPPDAPRDAPRDAADAGPRGLFAPCTTRLQCGTGMQCITVGEGYPGGHCTRECADDAACGDDGVCLPYSGGMRCFRRCETAADCREGYQCFNARGMPDPARACFPFCSADSQCTSSACNRWSRFCGTVDMSDGDNGAPCAAAGECRSSRCSREFNDDGTPTGNLGGICTSRCTVPGDAEYEGDRVPRGDCPTGSVCPRDTGSVAGGTSTCRVECTTNADCRPGYICSHPRRPGADAGTYANGYCAAMNCHFGTQMCPPIATCRTLASNDAGMPTSGICARNDGGAADGSVDATADGPAADAPADAPAGDAGGDAGSDAAADGGADGAG